ncbi:MAG: D-aminoacyl-tRNA deacylase [Marmoricola sp.]
MRAVLQRVSRASVSVADEVVGAIDEPGLVVLLGVTHTDGPDEVAWVARKIRELRIMLEERSLAETDGPALVVSQFTLYGDVRKGRRPSWQAAAPGDAAEPVYEQVCDSLERLGTRVARGRFGAVMQVTLVADGPVTVILDSPETKSRLGR